MGSIESDLARGQAIEPIKPQEPLGAQLSCAKKVNRKYMEIFSSTNTQESSLRNRGGITPEIEHGS